MRFLHIIPALEGGGAERQLAYLSTEQVAAGHETHVAYLHRDSERAPQHLAANGVMLHWLGRSSTGGAARRIANYDPGLCFRIAALIDRIDPDVVQTWLPQMHVAAGLACLAKDRVWVLREACSAEAYPNTWKSWLMKCVGRRATALVSNSLAGDRYWAGEDCRGPRYVVRNAVPAVAGRPGNPAGSPKPPSGKLALFAGRFTPQKNISVTLDAMLRVAEEDESVACWMCGEGPEREPAIWRSKRSPAAGRISFPGYRSDLFELMLRADVFVSVSRFEGAPNCVLEAMTAGSPLLVSDIPEHREFLDETCACLVDGSDTGAVADGLRKILSDPHAAKRRADRAKERAAGWSAGAMAAQYEQIYRTAVEAKGATRSEARKTAELL